MKPKPKQDEPDAPPDPIEAQTADNAARALDDLGHEADAPKGEGGAGGASVPEEWRELGVESYEDAARDIVTTAIDLATLIDGPHWTAPPDQRDYIARKLARVLEKYDQTWSRWAPEGALLAAVATFAFPRVLESRRLRALARAKASADAAPLN